MSIRRRKKRVAAVDDEEETVVFDDHDARVIEPKAQKARSPPKFTYRKSIIDYEGAGESQTASMFNSSLDAVSSAAKRTREPRRSSRGKATEEDEIEFHELADTVRPAKARKLPARKPRKGATLQSRTSMSPIFRAGEERDEEAYNEIFNPPSSLMPTLNSSSMVDIDLDPTAQAHRGSTSFSSVSFSLNRHIQEESSQTQTDKDKLDSRAQSQSQEQEHKVEEPPEPAEYEEPAEYKEPDTEFTTERTEKSRSARVSQSSSSSVAQQRQQRQQKEQKDQQRQSASMSMSMSNASRSGSSRVASSSSSARSASTASAGAPVRALLQDRPSHWGASSSQSGARSRHLKALQKGQKVRHVLNRSTLHPFPLIQMSAS